MLPRFYMVVWGLLTSGLLLGGCQVTVPMRTTHVQLEAPEEIFSVPTDKILLKPKSVLPSGAPGTQPASAGSPVPQAFYTPAPAGSPSGLSGQQVVVPAAAASPVIPPSVRVLQALRGIKLAPIRKVDGTVSDLLLDPEDPVLHGVVQVDGSAGLAVDQVSVRLEELAKRPPVEEPAVAGASPAPGAGSGAEQAEEPAPPVEVTLGLAELNWAKAWVVGQPIQVGFSVRHPAFLKFLAEHPDVSQIGLSLTPLDADGNPLPGAKGVDLELSCTLQVL